jgi:hypothetical protein
MTAIFDICHLWLPATLGGGFTNTGRLSFSHQLLVNGIHVRRITNVILLIKLRFVLHSHDSFCVLDKHARDLCSKDI